MDIIPVKRYKSPDYPDRKTVLENPEMLKSLPERWKGNVCVGAALSTLLLFTLTSCARGTGAGARQEAKVAPIFDHGSGRGSFGCVSVAPPSFLSEEEAFKVIQEEAKNYGITFQKDGKELEMVNIPVTKYNPTYDGTGEREPIDSTKKGNLRLDGYDPLKHIGFEFVSETDYSRWHGDEGAYSTVSSYEFLSAARVLGEGIEGKIGDTTVGVFYNPMAQLSLEERNEIMKNNNFEAMQARVNALAKDNLRDQVKDFLGWLKSQGII